MKTCDICGKAQEDDWYCNAAVVGEYIEIKGHKRCIESVNNLVVIPNRLRVLKLSSGIFNKREVKNGNNKR